MPSQPVDHPTDGDYQPDRVEALFNQALDMEPEFRSSFLQEACSDTKQRQFVEKLLAISEGGDHTAWREPAIFSVARAAAVGTFPDPVLERYRLLERIGAGGMGVVYKAVRSDQAFSKEVAIKIVQWTAADETVLKRFRTERQILAGLEHPNIARLLDGGATAEGSPFLVMEFVQGVPIDQYVAERKPPPKALLELFRRICAAVAYAHRNLVVHRDLKPANILVTDGPDGGPEPKLLDFGIARLLDDSVEHTRTAIMTLEYASPEQVAGAPIGTSSDIYSLGVLLYRLVSGVMPYRPTTGAVDLAGVISKDDPLPLDSAIDADLANIIRMALRKEPDRRYGSVEQLSEDLRRFEQGYPVLARPDTRGYRLRKFAGRNKLAIAAAALLVATLTGGIIATVRQARIAERRFNDVRKLANSYLYDTYEAIMQLPGSTNARKLVIDRALEYLDKLNGEHSGDAGLMRELAEAYGRVADVQGQPYVASLGDSRSALASYRKALALDTEILAGNPGDSKTAFQEVIVRSKVCQLLILAGDLKAAEREGRRVVESAEKLALTDSTARDVLPQYYSLLADVEGNPYNPNLGNTKLALELSRKGLAETGKVAAAHPGNPDFQSRWAGAYTGLAQMYQGLDDGPAAIEAYRGALEISESVFKANPTNTRYGRDAALSNSNLAVGYVLLLNDTAHARPVADRALELDEDRAKADPEDIEAMIQLGAALYTEALVRRDNPSESLLYSDKSIAILRSAMERGSDRSSSPILRAAWLVRADALTALGQFPKAIESAERELEIADALLKASPDNAGAQRYQGVAWAQIGKVHMARHEWGKARDFYRRACDVFEAQKQKGRLIPIYEKNLRDATAALAQCEKALSAL